MKNLLTIFRCSIFMLLLLVSELSFGQAKLNINGAKLNMGTGIYLSTNDVSVSSSVLTVAASTLKVANSISSSNAIDVSAGTLEMNGASAQSIPANSLTGNVIQNLTISGSDAVTVSGPLALTDVLTVANAGSLSSGGNLTLKSTSSLTARVAPITTSATTPVDGNVVVERYITSRRSFRFLTAPVNTPGSIRANWMENTNNPSLAVNNNPVPNYGTHITGYGGDVNGFDVTYTNNPSLFTWNNQTQTWSAVANTSGSLNAGAPYRILVRGSRSTDITQAAPPSSITTLRATGTLVSRTIVWAKPGGGGTTGMPELSNITGGYNFLANPYASPIDWTLVERTNLGSTIYVWDATLTGTNGRGAYVSYNSATGVSNIASAVDNNLQSGQAFFVQTTASDPVMTLRETHKSTEHRVVFRNGNDLPHFSLQLLLPGQDTTGGAADGLSAYFSSDFDTAVAEEDSYKFYNLDENIAIMHNATLLSIEGRKPIKITDTIPVKMWQLLGKSYSFRSVLTNFEPGVDAYLEDAYLQTSTKLNSSGQTLVPITITSDVASFAYNRFRIVFKRSLTLPVALSGLKAYVKNQGSQVDWFSDVDHDLNEYQIERSDDAQHFVTVGSVKTKQARGTTASYSWFDENPVNGNNYYRIKSVSTSGEATYSAVAMVHITRKPDPVSVFASSEIDNVIKVQVNNADKGEYAINLLNGAGQIMYSGSLQHPGGSAASTIKVNNVMPGGVYHLQVSIGNKNYHATILVP